MRRKTLNEFRRGLLGISSQAHRGLSVMDPDYFEALKSFYVDATVCRKDPALPRKVKEFIIMAICATVTNLHGVRVHMRRALLSGATPREILEALQAAAIPAGLPTLWNGIQVLQGEIKGRKRKPVVSVSQRQGATTAGRSYAERNG